MKKTTSQTLLPLLLILAACGNEPTQKPPGGSTAAQNAADAKLPPATYLEGIYATSSAQGKGVENLFDSNPATVWQTLPGAGPDEGIMLYFQDALDIGMVEVVTTEGNFLKPKPDEGEQILIYTNGEIDARGNPNKPIELEPNGLVKSLFVRFESTGKEELKTLRTGLEKKTYPADAVIAISELKVTLDNGETLRLAPPLRLKGRVSASSTLAPETAYSPANLFDSRKEFAWAEGAAPSGEGETLTFEFDQTVNITAVQIWNGYQRSDEHYAANARVRDFIFGEKSGQARTYTMRDTKAGQKIELQTPAKGTAFELKIKSIYPGKSYKDLAISDLVFYDGERPFALRSALPEKYQTALRANAAASPLAALLDKRIANLVYEDATLVDQSLILRSDGTFVMYSGAYTEGDPDIESYADGNWEMLSGTQVKVFGKWAKLLNGPELYEGVSRQNPSRIFNDVLTISADKVQGTKMLGTFYLK